MDAKLRQIAACGVIAATLAYVNPLAICGTNNAARASEGNAKMSDNMPANLKILLHADSFDDGVRGEAPTLSKNYLAYSEASAISSALSLDDLNYIMEHGTPAGKLYAAILLTSGSRVGKNLTFEKLLNDKSPVDYKSGCRGLRTTVGEVAKSFNDTGKYMNFSYSLFCKLTTAPPAASNIAAPGKTAVTQTAPHASLSESQPLPTAQAMAILGSAQCLDDFQHGDTNKPSQLWLAFQSLLKQGKDAKTEAMQLCKSPSAAARVYAAILLQQIDKNEGRKQISELLKDKTLMIRSQGCSREQAPVKDFAQRLLNGEQLVKLRDPNSAG